MTNKGQKDFNNGVSKGQKDFNNGVGTAYAMAACHQLLDYLATLPDAAIWYHASDMILDFETDA